MIKNERQFHITKTLLEKLEQNLAEVRKSNERPTMKQLQEEALKSQLVDLKNEILEYESTWASKRQIPELESFDEIPNALVRARLSLGLTQRELADRVGLAEQQIQRYEASNYQTASVARIRELINALGLTLSRQVQVPDQTITLRDFVKKLQGAGFDRDFILKRLLPPSVIQVETQNSPLGQQGLQVAQQVGRIFGWTPEQIFSREPLELSQASLGEVKFKLRGQFQDSQKTVHALYAQYIAMLVIQATHHLDLKRLPNQPYDIHHRIVDEYGSFTLEGALRFVWKLGVPVISMIDSAVFQGALFREHGRSAIIIRDRTHSHDRWLFDLFHEFWHAVSHQNDPTTKSLQFEDIRTVATRTRGLDDEEMDASSFASAVLLGRNPDQLVQECVKLADHDLRKLKLAVIQVAEIRKVSASALANCVAFRVSEIGEDWWGAAENLQEPRQDILRIARDVLLDFVDLSQLKGPDLDLLRRSLGYAEVLQ